MPIHDRLTKCYVPSIKGVFNIQKCEINLEMAIGIAILLRSFVSRIYLQQFPVENLYWLSSQFCWS